MKAHADPRDDHGGNGRRLRAQLEYDPPRPLRRGGFRQFRILLRQSLIGLGEFVPFAFKLLVLLERHCRFKLMQQVAEERATARLRQLAHLGERRRLFARLIRIQLQEDEPDFFRFGHSRARLRPVASSGPGVGGWLFLFFSLDDHDPPGDRNSGLHDQQEPLAVFVRPDRTTLWGFLGHSFKFPRPRMTEPPCLARAADACMASPARRLFKEPENP
jgi:hypothetical protein